MLDDLTTSTSPLRYTDDTAMTIALAEAIVATGRLDEDSVAARFAEVYVSDPNRGYGGGTAALLARMAAGADWRTQAAGQFGGQGSFGNGAAMRAAPLAVYAGGEPSVACGLARRAARITHTHPEAVEGAAIQAGAVALALRAPSGTDIDGATFCRGLAGLASDSAYVARLETAAEICERAALDEVTSQLGNGVAAIESVPTAVCAFALHTHSFTDAVRFALSCGGDSDTIASMTAAIAGALHGVDAIPREWLRRCEGVDRLTSLADRVAAAAPNPGSFPSAP